MPDQRINLVSSNNSSTSDEAAKLELYLQRQLEEDVARIFDESIYSDLEVVCGKLKLLTHSCILKARTNKFYNKLEAILQVNFGKEIFDEIYSFISDAYTECDIKTQEKEILIFLKGKILTKNSLSDCNKTKEDLDEVDVFLTPNSTSPYTENKYQQIACLSPSTELTKEYYALVHIEGNLLDQELNEQDALSNAFHTIIKTQETESNKVLQHSKPTSLSLVSSHSSKTIKHSNNCDIYNKVFNEHTIFKNCEKKSNNQSTKLCQPIKENNGILADKILDATYSPDSLVTDDPSSSSDYLSAAYAHSPALGSSNCFPHLNVSENNTKMENVFTSSDSGLSFSSHKEVTITDTSLTETYNVTTDETLNLQASTSSPDTDNKQARRMRMASMQGTTSSLNDISETASINRQKNVSVENDISYCKSSKEEKQRQNEEIVILESSSVSSETGSWESVFPPKMTDKEICDKFIHNERQYLTQSEVILEKSNYTDYYRMEKLNTKHPGPCFIDAANLVDEDLVSVPSKHFTHVKCNNKSELIHIPSKPVPIANKKLDISPGDGSESNDNEDSLEQGDNKDSDSILKDLSPTIFEMTFVAEDLFIEDRTLSVNSNCKKEKIISLTSSTDYLDTPHNSMMSLTTTLKPNEVEETAEENFIVSNFTDFKPNYQSSPVICSREFTDGTYSLNHGVENSIPIIRKIENGGSFHNEDNNINKTPKSIYTSAWVVDMSNQPKEVVSEAEFDRFSPNLYCKKLSDKSCEIIKNERKPSNSDNCKSRGSVNSDSSEKSGHKFFIDLSTLPDPLPPEKPVVNMNDSEKKSMFSMYIDLGANSSPKDVPSRFSLLNNKNQTIENKNCVTHKNPRCSEKKKASNLKPQDLLKTSEVTSSPDPVIKVENDDFLKCQNKIGVRAMQPSIKENKSCSETLHTNSTFEKYESLCSNTRISISEIIAIPENTFKSIPKEPHVKEKCKTEKSFLHIKADSSSCSKANNSNISFENYESLCSDPNISISEIIAISEMASKPKNTSLCEPKSNKIEKPSFRSNKDDKIIVLNTVNVIQEESSNTKDKSADLFVKLSDLDKPTQKCDIFERDRFDSRMTRSIPDNNWLGHSGQATSYKSSDVIISSFHSENALSLNRLFPHLKNEFSKSMPISLSVRTRSPLRPGAPSSVGEIDEQVSEGSEISSVPSSMCRSVIENSTTEDTSQTLSLIGNCQSRLGQDLLRMFLEEIAPDVVVEVSGKRIKAHKCILSSRCQYFAGILSGGWVESAGNVIALPPFSYNVAHFALCHIYSGIATIPDSISIVELATIADMLSLEGLKEAIMYTLKAKYCHHFHKPCQVCTVGVLECFPLSSVYGLDDLYSKCLRWITKYFPKVWPTKAFATLPKELLDKCYQEHIVNLSIDNVIDTVYGCGITVASLQNSRWAESVARMCRRLVNAAAHFAAPRLMAILEMIPRAPECPQAARQALDDCLAAAIEWAPPDETCRAYAFLSNLIKEIRNQHPTKTDLMTNGTPMSKVSEPNLFTQASSWRLQCEGALVRAAPRVVGTQAFKDLPPDLRKRLRELGCIMYGPQTVPLTTSSHQERKSKSTYQNKPYKMPNSNTNRSLDMERVRNTFVPYKPVPVKPMGSKDKIASNTETEQRDIKKATVKVTALKVRTTKAQEERTKFNQTKSLTSQNNLVSKTITHRVHPFENTKPRYLESRPVPKEIEKKMSPKKFVNKVISSSESSRNSSPVQSKNLRNNRMAVEQKSEVHGYAISQDSLATTSRPRTAELSTDSLSESQTSNRYATYTKTKHGSKGSVESVVSKCQGLSPSSLLNSNIKTKIPIFQSLPSNASKQAKTTCVRLNRSLVQNQSDEKVKTKSCDRKGSGFRSATKSSSAKVVPRVAKEQQVGHPSNKPTKQIKTSKHTNKKDDERKHVMERSGTFLKDEPTFGDKTTNIDKSQ